MQMVAKKIGGTGGKSLALAVSCAGIFLAVLCSTSANTAYRRSGPTLVAQ
jgi:hypothetical protein